MSDTSRIYINGQWVDSTSTDLIDVVNPTTEQAIGATPDGTTDDVDRAVKAAHAAFDGWASRTRAERADLLRTLADVLGKRGGELAEIITSEVGTPIKVAQRIQAALPITDIKLAADYIEQVPEFEQVGNSMVFKEPVGVVAAIAPWNYPVHQVTSKLAPALATGCTVVVKPSEVAPLSTYVLFEALHEVGLPPGVVNLVSGRGPVVGQAMSMHDLVDAVSFTGSVAGGVTVSSAASPSVKRVTLELGGKSANVILDDADLSSAVKVGVANAFLNAGQTCTAWTRMLVSQEQAEEAYELAAKYAAAYTMGDPLDPATRMGPLASAQQRDRVRASIDKAKASGARLLTGGSDAPPGLARGYFVSPTVFGEVDPDSELFQEEVFGPVLAISTYKDEDDALRLANNSTYGLHGAVWSASSERALAFARRVRTGQIDVNGAAYNPQAPFGGYKRSGFGREMGHQGLEEFFEIKSIQV